MSYFIGIDIGASFIKGALFDLNRLKIKNIIKYPTPTSSIVNKSQYARFEVDPKLYVKSVKKIIDKLLINEEIDGVVFSTQMHGMILVDKELNEITPFIGWQDERLLEQSNRKNLNWLTLLNRKLKHVNTSNTGTKFRSGLMGPTLFWLKENKILDKNKDAKALFLGDYVAAKITNGKRVVNMTNACGCGFFDVKNKFWDNEILNVLKISESYLPDIVETGEVIGYYKRKKKSIPVYVSVGDLQAAILGSLLGLGKERQICINIGTGSQVSFVTNKFKTGNYDIRSYFDNNYLYTVTHIPGGRALNVIIKFIEGVGSKVFNNKNNIDIWEKLADLIANKQSCNDLKCSISYFKNNVTEDTTGCFTNITENNWTIENMFYSALERMAQNYWTSYQRFGENGNKDRIICSGRLIRQFKPLKRLIEGRFNKKISLAVYEEEALVGLFILSLFCKGDYKDLRSASKFCQKNKISFE